MTGPHDHNATTGDTLPKFQELLSELFQFEDASLDFGVYRIMNHKRDAIRRFIEEKLPAAVNEALDSGPLAAQSRAVSALDEAAQQVRAALGDDATDDNGALAEQWHTVPLGQRYLEAQAAAAGAVNTRATTTASIYNHLYQFFHRYYQDGDFISQRRYSRSQRYAIPYNGEEVYLHWANRDQYYVKSDAHFRNYDWNAPNGVAVHFRLDNANVEQNNVKGETRFFLPLSDQAHWDDDARTITIPFEYRPLQADEKTAYKRRNTQEDIIAQAVAAIPQTLTGPTAAAALAALNGEHRRNAKDEPVSRLEHHLRRYAARNNADFFIHQDLAGFLNRELDFYLKNEVLNLDDLTHAGQDLAEGWFQTLRLVKSIGAQIIDFLAQIEDFQKTLWEKRKFVTATHYAIALGCVDPDLYHDIAANNAQWREWQTLHAIDGTDRTPAFLRAHPTLMLDTRHCDAVFTDRILATFDDLDGMTDGLLLHGDNWQALNLMAEKYAGQVKCIYIDPPYNTAASEILYKNGYKHSSWLSLVNDRISVSSPMLGDNAAWVIAIDDTEMVGLTQLIDSHYTDWDRHMVIVNHHPAGSGLEGTNVSSTHEYAVFMTPTGTKVLGGPEKNAGTAEIGFVRTGSADSNLRIGRPNSFYAVLVEPVSSTVVGVEEPPTGADYPLDKTDEGFTRIYPVSSDGTERVWRRSYVSVMDCIQRGEIVCKNGKSLYLVTDQTGKRRPLFSNWTDKKYNAGTHGTNLIKALFGDAGVFPYPKSIHTVRDSIDACIPNSSNATVLDYFAGSGTTAHAVINLNREDGGRRKFILVEMGEYFDTVLLPRIKKAVYTPEWRNGQPRRAATPEEAERSPRIIKYQTLESYEDALDSIEFEPPPVGQPPVEEILGDEYVLKYMLRWETKGSATLLNAGELTRPFSYRLHVHSNGEQRERTVDLPETFNWLLGLKVRTRQAYYDDAGRRYLVYRGATRERPGQPVTVIWRDTAGWTADDYARNVGFVADNIVPGDATVIYVNGGSSIPGTTALEPLFKARMFAAVNG